MGLQRLERAFTFYDAADYHFPFPGLLDKLRAAMNPSVYIVAGPNGAGKTTFAREFLPHYADCRNFINADLIAQGVSPFAPEIAAFRAGRLMLGEISFSRGAASILASRQPSVGKCM